VCGAYAAASSNTAAWVSFQGTVGALANLDPTARAVLVDPAACP
jgi:hypothetical protein